MQDLLEEWGMESSSIVGTPGGREESGKTGMEEGGEIKDQTRITRYRRVGPTGDTAAE